MEIKSSTRFCHYTTIESARCILDTECLIMSRYDGMNDLAESKLHAEDTKRVFVLSLCHSESQNIPLFYLYAGIDGKGCRLQFSDAKIREILRDCTVSYVNKQKKRLKVKVPREDYDIYCDWIHYISTDGFCSYRGKESQAFVSSQDAYERLKAENKLFFIKSPIWKFENEFRIVIVFKKDIEYDHIALNFHIKEKERGLSVVLGPETTNEELIALQEEFGGYGIVQCKRVSDAAVRMNLLDKNKSLLKKREG